MQRPVSRSSTYLPSHMTKEDFEHMRIMAQKHFDKIMQVLKDMPRPILLIIRLVFLFPKHSTSNIISFAIDIIQNAYFIIYIYIELVGIHFHCCFAHYQIIKKKFVRPCIQHEHPKYLYSLNQCCVK